ncbi:DUF2878 domain-containing protein [Colwellia sp. 20A7]|uniref:DUF2878 domain-containing protein n=1 Tax=Colwellia sp. 20A7 TaxID=2689569 RepID=UPI0013576DFD|nr:DUF2878 domain-containing protein [Colwellia sp. 20A7]
MLLNIIGFNIAWFGLILLENRFIPVVLLWIGLHFYFCKQRVAEAKLIVSVATIGIVIDSALLFFDVFQFKDQLVIPLWLIMLWIAFAATVAHSLQFLSRAKVFQLIVGFIFPPLSYIVGESLTSMTFGFEVLTTYFILAVIWSILMVLFFHLKKMFYFQEKNNV